MPKINRIRISNVTYDKKRILDQIYTTCDGENVLFNLANGSGKSVLVQLMLQSILPKVKIHGRNVESYLPSDKSTAYVMLEWKLDNTAQPTYFMTGIAMCLGGNDENNSKLKYFTFTNDYVQANEFDIANIPLIEKDGQSLKYCSYENAMKLIRQSEESRVGYFPSDQGEDYKKALAQHGVFVDEWKIIARINEQEGGVDELFKKSSTSDKLVDDWILKTVIDSMDSSNDLQEMFIALMKSVMEQNENIKNKELLTKFDSSAKAYETKISELLASLNKSKDIETQLKELYHYCGRQRDAAEQKIGECHERLKEVQIKKDRITYERISENYYIEYENYSILMEELEEKKQELLVCNEKYKSDKLKKESYEAAEVFNDIQKSKGELSVWMQRQEELSHEERDERMQNIGYSLLRKYRQLDNDIEQKISEDSKCLTTKKVTETELGNRIYQMTADEKEKSRISGGLLEKCKSFKNEEARIFSELKIHINRLLNGQLDETEVETQQKIYIAEIKSKSDEYINLKKRQDEVNSRISEVDEAIANYTQQSNNTEKYREAVFQDKNTYLEKRSYLLDVLWKYEIGSDREFSKSFNKQDIEERKRELSVIQQKLTARIEKQKELISALEKGIVHTSMDLVDLLQKEGIEFETGEQYLNKEKEGRRKTLLEKNPALPYCYLVAQKDMSKVINLKLSEPMMRTIPILSFEDIEADLHPTNAFVTWNNGLLACNYHEKCFDVEMRQEFKAQIENDLASMENEHRNRETALNGVIHDLKTIDEYPYETGYIESVERKLGELSVKLNEIAKTLGEFTKEKNSLDIEARNIPDKLNQSQNDQNEIKREQSTLESYLLKDKQYLYDRNKYEEVKQNLLDMAKEKADLAKQKEEVLKKIREMDDQLRSYQATSAQYKDKINIVSVYETGELLSDDIYMLEQQFYDLQKERSSTKKEIDDNINRINKAITEYQNRLNRFAHISPEQYESIMLDDKMFDRFVRNEKDSLANLENAKLAASRAETQAKVAESRAGDEKKRLKDIGYEEPLPTGEIKRNYDSRLKDLNKQKDEVMALENEQSKRQNEYGNKQTAITRTLEPSEELLPLQRSDVEYEAIDIKVLSKELRNTVANNESFQKELHLDYLTTKNEFEDKHSLIAYFISSMDTSGLNLQFDDYYFVYERLTDSRKRLNDYIEVIDSALRTIEEDTKHINQHALEHGKRIHQEMSLIAKSASVRLEGRRTPQQMLAIDIPEQLDSYCGDRIKEYIDYCIEVIRKECESSDNMEEIVRKKVKILLSDRKIFNVVIDKETLKVKLYKADISIVASELRLWEDVLIGNSGGQMFISCFAMISALIDYTRNKAIESSGGEKLEVSKSFIIDNPFGKMSSNHLLDILVKIAEKFNSQMICLSDLSQSSITNRFSVIYQLKLQKAKYSNQTYLQTVDYRTRGDVYRNEKLEHAFLKTKQVQMSLYD